ncbi:hypothetical protein [Falsirhodobacter deserti]|uniref:hypothetical protein n=1 Tax=Falsirhodobacter deserti TaxID=1365611 RepID=UPI0019D428B9|nr:hypothetical protein [Falsirhodobacter deserti]
MIAFEYTGWPGFGTAAAMLAVLAVTLFVPSVRPSRLVFVAVAVLLTGWATLTRDDWLLALVRAAQLGATIISLFTALSALRNAAMSSSAILECGRVLARQRPGLRYVALTLGGHLFSLILLYGSISLLGSLAVESSARDPNPVVRTQRTRRMMIAIQRGFASTLCWSPLGFSMVITTTIVPGANWAAAALPCIVSAILMLVIGWGLDAIYKPPATGTAWVGETERWSVKLRPLLVLLGIVIVGVAALHVLTGVEVIGAVMLFVPLLALVWIYLQPPPADMPKGEHARRRAKDFIATELPSYNNEILLLFMAGFIGSIGGFLLAPMASAHGPDLTAVPPWMIVAMMVWIIPITGQLGMNPILAVSLLVPILPTPAEMGIPPTALVAAITGGWALSGTTSPYTASVLLAAKLGGVSAARAGLGWNGIYTLAAGAAMTGWGVALIYIL